jgi:hypothetical protein
VSFRKNLFKEYLRTNIDPRCQNLKRSFQDDRLGATAERMPRVVACEAQYKIRSFTRWEGVYSTAQNIRRQIERSEKC